MIKQEHEIPLATAVSKSCPGRGSIAQALYNECESLFLNQPTRTTTVSKTRNATPVKEGNQIVATVTDEQTGLFVQLSGVINAEGRVATGPWLVFGKKFLEESKNPQLSNTGVKLWH